MSSKFRQWRGDCDADVLAAARALLAERPVAFPTETVYGLGPLASSPTAIAALFAAKRRPPDNPLIVHLASPAQLHPLLGGVPLPARAARLASLWPAPLTIILPLPDPSPFAAAVTAGRGTFGVRVPRHPVALALLAAVGAPVAAPSANRSGRPSPTTAAHVVEDLGDCEAVAGVVVDLGEDDVNGNGGRVGRVGVESTVVDVTGPKPVILRPGGIGRETVEEVLGERVEVASATWKGEGAPRAPGMKYRHYAPQAPMILADSKAKMSEALEQAFLVESQRRVGLLLGGVKDVAEIRAALAEYESGGLLQVTDLGEHPDDVARGLFGALRDFDHKNVSSIVAWICVTDDGVGAAIMNRIRKAASGGSTVLRTGDVSQPPP